jgi:hypothetical protein
MRRSSPDQTATMNDTKTFSLVSASIVVVCQDPDVGWTVEDALKGQVAQVLKYQSAQEAIQELKRRPKSEPWIGIACSRSLHDLLDGILNSATLRLEDIRGVLALCEDPLPLRLTVCDVRFLCYPFSAQQLLESLNEFVHPVRKVVSIQPPSTGRILRQVRATVGLDVMGLLKYLESEGVRLSYAQYREFELGGPSAREIEVSQWNKICRALQLEHEILRSGYDPIDHLARLKATRPNWLNTALLRPSPDGQ